MQNETVTRVQVLLNKVESLKVKKIEDETKVKRFEEDLKECENNLKELGYNSVEEATLAMSSLETTLAKECSEIETILSGLNLNI